MIVAIDGPAAAGKSTVARAVARELGFTYLDSGAMYRIVALLWREDPARDVAELAGEAVMQVGERVEVNGRDVTEAIRAPDISEATSLVAADPRVRAVIAEKQRALLASGDWVAEGRDIGTVIAPHAELKIYLDAAAEERATRRAAQVGGSTPAIEAELVERDERDSTRADSPLRQAPGAVRVDTTGVGVHDVVARIAALARSMGGR
jgi:CMP/dCMP kinase